MVFHKSIERVSGYAYNVAVCFLLIELWTRSMDQLDRSLTKRCFRKVLSYSGLSSLRFRTLAYNHVVHGTFRTLNPIP